MLGDHEMTADDFELTSRKVLQSSCELRRADNHHRIRESQLYQLLAKGTVDHRHVAISRVAMASSQRISISSCNICEEMQA